MGRTSQNPHWTELAACLGQTQTMFPYTAVSGQDRAAGQEWTERWAASKQICDRCVVALECLEDALTYPFSEDEYGMRGGLTPQQRKRIRLRRKR